MSPSVNGGWRTPRKVVLGPAVCRECGATVWLERSTDLAWWDEQGRRHRCVRGGRRAA